MKKLIIAIFVLIIIFPSCKKKKEKNSQPYLVIWSLDGFRWDYPKTATTPTLDSLKKAGVIAESLKPSFPTKTFPNHYTLATGLYPDHHGIVLNSFYAPDLEKSYSIRDRESIANGSFYGGEPIWVTAEKQNLKAATLFWVGATAEIKGTRPSFWSYYDESMPFDSRINSIFKWLSLPEQNRPHLIMAYYHEPDLSGHIFGPESTETVAKVEELDHYLNLFFTKLRKLDIYNQINFIITSDHGMNPISLDKRIILDQIIDTADLAYWDGGNPNYNIKVKDGMLNEVYDALVSGQQNYSVWKHEELPDRLHYGNNIRTHDITIVANEGWSVYWSWNDPHSLGTHGYDNDLKDMHAIFYAAGSAFKEGYVHPTFENVNVYVLMTEILGLSPAQTDGALENVQQMLIIN